MIKGKAKCGLEDLIKSMFCNHVSGWVAVYSCMRIFSFHLMSIMHTVWIVCNCRLAALHLFLYVQ